MTTAPCALLCLLIAGAPSAMLPDDAVRLALAHSGAVTAARIDAQVAALERGLRWEPLELRVGHRSIDQLTDAPDDPRPTPGILDDAFVALGFKLPSPADIAALRAEHARAQADGLEVDSLRAMLAAQVRVLHARVLASREEEQLVQSARLSAELFETQTRARVAVHAASELDAHLAALDRLDAMGDLEEIGHETRRLEHELVAATGAASPIVLARGPALCRLPDATDDGLVAQAIGASSELKGLDARREEAQLHASLAWAAWVPALDNVLVGLSNSPSKTPETRLRLDFALPVLAPLSGDAQALTLRVQRLEALKADAHRRLEVNVRSAAQRLRQAHDVVRVYESGQDVVVARGLADVARAIDAGESDVLRLAEVQRRALRTQRGLVRARLRCEEAAIQLLRLTGTVIPADG